MGTLPRVIVSSVIRSAHQGESHGGVYLVDLESGQYEQVIDWNDPVINWEGRGGDRGLRGIAFYQGRVYLAASDEILVYDPHFCLLDRYKNRYLRQCHEIFVSDGTLFITSTKFDSILLFDLDSATFVRGYTLRYKRAVNFWIRLEKKYFFHYPRGMLSRLARPTLTIFDPNSEGGPRFGDTTHINNVHYQDGKLFVAGVRLGNLFYIEQDRLSTYARLPYGTHNARPFREGVLANHTASNQVVYLDRGGCALDVFLIPVYKEQELLMADLPRDHARQGFARGLCVTEEGLIIAGSSPATISVYRFGQPTPIKTINISMDIRNAIHGLEIWPF